MKYDDYEAVAYCAELLGHASNCGRRLSRSLSRFLLQSLAMRRLIVAMACSERIALMKRLALVAVVALLATACGSDSAPVAPTPQPASIAGGWSGTVQYTQASSGSALQVQAIAFSLTQAGASVNGTYAAQSFSGTVTGTTTTTAFSGTLTFNATTNAGAACTGTFAASGDAGSNTMTWTSPLVSASCTNTPLGITMAIQRR